MENNTEGRIQAILSLKKNIEAGKQKATHLLKPLSKAIPECTDSPELVLQKKLHDLEKEKRIFEKDQKRKQQYVSAKILEEEKEIQRRQKQQPYLWSASQNKPNLNKLKPLKLKQRQLQKLNKLSKDYDAAADDADKFQACWSSKGFSSSSGEEDEEDPLLSVDIPGLKRHIADAEPTSFLTDATGDDVEGNLFQLPSKMLMSVQPVVPDLCGSNQPEAGVASTRMQAPPAGKLILDARLELAGKERAFACKPSTLYFKDFEVGKSYKKKAILTNVSQSSDFIKFSNVSENLQEFLEIRFPAPGQMSAGLHCELTVVYTPLVNADVDGQINMACKRGLFSIPVVCHIKKAKASVASATLDFGETVVGEALTKCLEISNTGALQTSYTVKPFIVTELEAASTKESTTDFDGAKRPDNGEVTTPDQCSVTMIRTGSATDGSTVGSEGNQCHPETIQSSTDAGGEKQQAETSGEVESKQALVTCLQEEPHAETPGENEGQHEPTMLHDDPVVFTMVKENGIVGARSSVSVPVTFTPPHAGRFSVQYRIDYSDNDCAQVPVGFQGSGVDIPVSVHPKCLDMKICVVERLHQDSITVHNRGNTATKVQFDVPRQLRDHMEVLPKNGFVQAKSQLTALIRFLPRGGILHSSMPYFDGDTGVLQAPVNIRVGNHTKPLDCYIYAIVTSSDLTFSDSSIDFGHCTVYETVIKCIQVKNPSLVRQELGFVKLPACIDVQPGDGFISLLPQQTATLQLLFSPTSAKMHHFHIVCKTTFSRCFKIECSGIGVEPPLRLSHQVVAFAPTCLYNTTTTTLHISYPHRKHACTSKPDQGDAPAATGERVSYGFAIPDGCPVSVQPRTGTLAPGESQCLALRFKPTLHDEYIRKCAASMIDSRHAEEHLLRKTQLSPQTSKLEKEPQKKHKKGKESAASKRGSVSRQQSMAKVPSPDEPPSPVAPSSIDENSDDYRAAKEFLMRLFDGSLVDVSVPCFLARGSVMDAAGLRLIDTSTLYVELSCPAVRPDLLLLPHAGHVVDFGAVAVGRRTVQRAIVENVSECELTPTATPLDLHGPFWLLNALRPLPPATVSTLVIEFAPKSARSFLEVLHVKAGASNIAVTLRGEAVLPVLELEIEGTGAAEIEGANVVEMGCTLIGDTVTKTFAVKNVSSIPVQYSIVQDSMVQDSDLQGGVVQHSTLQVSKIQHSEVQGSVVQHSKEETSIEQHSELQDTKAHQCTVQHSVAGEETAEHPTTRGSVSSPGYVMMLRSCQPVFSCSPAAGTLQPGAVATITTTFHPDRACSAALDDIARIVMFGKQEAHVVRLHGSAAEHAMYVRGGATFPAAGKDALMITAPLSDVVEKTILLHLKTRAGSCLPVTARLYVGVVQSTSGVQKKNGEFQVDGTAPASECGFVIEPTKAQVDAGTEREVLVTWKPSNGEHMEDEGQVIRSEVSVTLKGDVQEQYRLLLQVAFTT